MIEMVVGGGWWMVDGGSTSRDRILTKEWREIFLEKTDEIRLAPLESRNSILRLLTFWRVEEDF
jgi:hypothetical protein